MKEVKGGEGAHEVKQRKRWNCRNRSPADVTNVSVFCFQMMKAFLEQLAKK